MYIADAVSAKHWADVENLDLIIEDDKELSIEKENLWHEIKKACIRGQYDTTYLSLLTGDKARQLAIIFKGYGYDVCVTQAGFFHISWKFEEENKSKYVSKE